MGQSLCKNLVHIIFSTKNRRPLLKNEFRNDFHSFAAGILNELKSPPLIINSVEDHGHFLVNVHRTIAVSNLVMHLKKGSSKWIKTLDPAFWCFEWQNGFGAFSISQSAVPEVRTYIENQAVHHQKISFQDELRTFLKKYEIEFDEQYLWD